jgi:hypothetical protein
MFIVVFTHQHLLERKMDRKETFEIEAVKHCHLMNYNYKYLFIVIIITLGRTLEDLYWSEKRRQNYYLQ